MRRDVAISNLGAWCVALLSLGCASTTDDVGNIAGNGGARNDGGFSNSSGGPPTAGSGGLTAAGAGGVMMAGSGGAPLGGGAGSGATTGGAGATSMAGAGASAGGDALGGAGSGGLPNGGSAGNAGAAGTGAGGDGGGGQGGIAGSDAGAANGGASGGAPAGCHWENPEGRITLFDGSTLSGWQDSTTGQAASWRLAEGGTMEVVPANPSRNIETTMKLEDLCLHLEYQTPMYAANVTGQQRGNSGIYFRRSYEMQVLDTYGQPPAIDGCGAVYGISPPLDVACNMQLVWNTYEIEFKASRWNGGTKTENAVFVTASLNGTVVQRDVELDVPNTTAGNPDAAGPQPLMLQDHGNPVRFRNIWAKVPRY